jgi:hypothetical protein
MRFFTSEWWSGEGDPGGRKRGHLDFSAPALQSNGHPDLSAALLHYFIGATPQL